MSETESSTPPLDTPPPAPTIPANAGRETTAPPEATAVDAPVMGGDTVLSPTLENAALTTTAQETEKTVKSKEGRDLLKWLYEKVTPNIVQDLVERVKVWGNDKLASRKEKSIAKLTAQLDEERGKNTEMSSSALKKEQSLLTSKELLEQQGLKLSAADSKKNEDDVTALRELVNKGQEKAKALTTKIESIEEAKGKFEAKAEAVRNKLIEKLDKKQESNNTALEKHRQDEETFRGAVSRSTTERDNLIELEKKIQEQVDAGGPKLKDAFRQIKEKRKELDVIIKQAEKNFKDVSGKIKKLEITNGELDAKKTKIKETKKTENATNESTSNNTSKTDTHSTRTQPGAGGPNSPEREQITFAMHFIFDKWNNNPNTQALNKKMFGRLTVTQPENDRQLTKDEAQKEFIKYLENAFKKHNGGREPSGGEKGEKTLIKNTVTEFFKNKIK